MRFADLDAVTLDAFGTLVELTDPVPAVQEGLLELGVERDRGAVTRALAAEFEYYRPRSLEGRDPESLALLRRECAGIVLRELEADVEPEAFVDSFVGALRFALLPRVTPALRGLRRRGLALAVVSNWDIALGEHLRALGLGDVPVVTSAAVGAAKPDPTVFRRALELLQVRPERTLHVGDSHADEAGARAAGITFAPAPLAAALEALT
jgi:HAD superfamily hydrolase (TIGR01509 family)